jgi:hypothetical protein
MQILSLHHDQRMILETLRMAADSLKLTEHMAIVGGLARHLSGDPEPPGDIDVLVEAPVCDRYWELAEILTRHGINSGWEVFDPPNFSTWNPCNPEDIGHAMHFALQRGEQVHERLDFCFTVENLDRIPKSGRWIREKPRVSKKSGASGR